MVLSVGDAIDNQTLCDLLGVANTGGIRVNNRRSLIVLISNNTDPTYRNEWRDGELHFVGMGSVGPQTLGRQNKTLANAAKRGYAIHLFEVSEKGRYVYAGEVELAGEPYLSDQPDARANDRFVWIFPLLKKPPAPDQEQYSLAATEYLPHGAYAVVGAEAQRALADETMDKLKEAGVPVFDQRDVDRRRYERKLDRWHEAVLDRVRLKIKELIANRKRAAKAAGREFNLVDDELKINSASTEAELRAALIFLDYDDPEMQEQVFVEARQSVSFPEPPRPGPEPEVYGGELEEPEWLKKRDRNRFKDFT